MKPIKNNNFQIIAGEYRGRKLNFLDTPNLRPTPNKVRETLFNWLQFEIHNKSFLDLFSGSGALSFEALSRGASNVVSVEKNLKAYNIIKNNTKILQTSKLQVVNMDAFDFLTQNQQTFDFILLDPPFNKNFLPKILELILKNNFITSGGKIYIESEFKMFETIITNQTIKINKQKHSGQVHYCLIEPL